MTFIKNHNHLNYTGLSKFLSLILRHKPQTIGLQLDSKGWAMVDELLQKMEESGKPIDFEILKKLVETDSKQRYAFNEDCSKIRANQGHSIPVELGYEPKCPPEILFHGTSSRFVESILKSGILKQNRHHVHMSSDMETAVKVGKRHGKPAVFEVFAEKMHDDEFKFYVSENGVWLTEEVPVMYLNLNNIV